MSIHRWLPIVVVIAVLLAGAGLRVLISAPSRTNVVVWFLDQEGRYLAPVTRSVAAVTPASAIAELLAGPAPETPLQPAVQTSTLVDLAENDGELTVTLEPLSGAAGQEALARTLLSVPGVKAVQVAGRRWTAVDFAPSPEHAIIYYPLKGVPVPVLRPLPAGTEPVQTMSDKLRAVLNAFLTEPPPPGLNGPPLGISVEGLIVKEDVAYVRLGLSPGLTQAVLSGAWNFSPYYLSVVHTVTEFPGIMRVQFDFPGLTAAALRQCRTPLSVPLPRPHPERGRA